MSANGNMPSGSSLTETYREVGQTRFAVGNSQSASSNTMGFALTTSTSTWGGSSHSSGSNQEHSGKAMNARQAKRMVVEECLAPRGFAFSIRENRVDQQAFSRLLGAVGEITREIASEDLIDRLVVACLFEMPWEIENTVDHYSKQSPELGVTVSKMAEELRSAIGELLWTGLESHYDSQNKE